MNEQLELQVNVCTQDTGEYFYIWEGGCNHQHATRRGPPHPRVTNGKCLRLVYSPDQVKRKILEVWVRRQARLVQINGLIISY